MAEQEALQEEFEFISLDEFKRRTIKTRLDPQTFAKYANAIQQVKEDGACHVKTTTYASSRKNLLKVASQVKIPLTVEKTKEGLVFRIATEEELEKRKERGQKLVEARAAKKTTGDTRGRRRQSL